MLDEKSVTLSTGPRACGKSLIGEVLRDLANDPQVVFEDTSKIIKLHIQRSTPIGLECAKYTPEMAGGTILPDKLVFDAVMQWLSEKEKRQKIRHFILGGSPRGFEQAKLWKNSFPGSRLIHTKCEKEDVHRWIIKRQEETGEIREDEGQKELETAWNEYEIKVIPGVGFYGKHALHVHRNEPFRFRLEKAIMHLNMPDPVKNRWLARLDTKNHPVCLRVNELDGGWAKKPKPAKKKSATESLIQTGDLVLATS